MPIRIVLVDPAHPGNIGAAARAMKNMGLTDLHLVRPRYFPNSEATARASGAEDVLEAARVHERFEDAIEECGLVVGTSARSRHLSFDLLEPRECAQEIAMAAQTNDVAVVFGSERIGLTNAELARCHRLVTIPTHPDYSSLNLAMAVQVMAYEIWLAIRPGAPAQPPLEVPLATATEMERLYRHIEEVLDYIDFRDRTGSGHLMARIRRLFNRARLDQNEINILRGILTAVQGRRRPALPPKRAGNQRSAQTPNAAATSQPAESDRVRTEGS
ncbi:MAG TPA: RNA methyltransferase [Steroidobacteraceae bacterium]